MGDDFAGQYRALRIREGWARSDGLEDPAVGDPGLWSGRIKSVTEAARALSELASGGHKPLIVDIGAGGAWTTRFLPWATVIAVDLIPPVTATAMFVRGDMRHLPLQSGCADGVLFAASLHYAPLHEAVSESARVLRPGGLMVVVDSPMYRNSTAREAAAIRSRDYYRKSGFPTLASHYLPIDSAEMRSILDSTGFRVSIWRTGASLVDRIRRPFGPSHASMVVARLT